MDADIFAACARRRVELADFVDGLSAEQLTVPSMCAGWDVRTVLGHLMLPLVVSTPRIVLAMLRNGGSFDRANDALARAEAARPVPELTALLRERASARVTPPGKGPAAPLTDLCVHTADIRVPLGLDHGISAAEAEMGLNLLAESPRFLVARGRLDGLLLAPDDLDRTWGAGQPVHGSAAELLLAAFGRAPFPGRVSGPGAAELAARSRH